MLDFLEEIVLLQIEHAAGRAIDHPSIAPVVVVAGAAIMQLSLQNRVDADLDRLYVANAEPTGDPILDDVLKQLELAGADFSARTALENTIDHADGYREAVLQRLVAKGILREIEARRYAIVEDREHRELKERLRQELLSDQIPDPNNIMLIGIVEAAGLLGLVLSAPEIQRTQTRIDQVCRLDLIGHALAWAIADFRVMTSYTSARAY